MFQRAPYQARPSTYASAPKARVRTTPTYGSSGTTSSALVPSRRPSKPVSGALAPVTAAKPVRASATDRARTKSRSNKKPRAAPAPGSVVMHNGRSYAIGRAVGKGGFADVFKFQDLDSKAVWAGKVIDYNTLKSSSSPGSDSKIRRLEQEIKIHKSLNNQYIVKLAASFDKNIEVKDSHPPTKSKFHCILLEYCNGGSLMDVVKSGRPLAEHHAARLFLQIVSGVRYLHQHNIIHRDLKLGNIFLINPNDPTSRDIAALEARIGDFGLATQVSENERRKTMCGTPNYIAPEIISKDKTIKAAGHSFEVDIWSLGVILFTLLVGTPPFQAENQALEATYQNINAVKYNAKLVRSVRAQDLISRMLQSKPSDRWSLDQIANHEFIKKHFPREEDRRAIYPPSSRPPLQSLTSHKPRPNNPYALTPSRSSGVENSSPNPGAARLAPAYQTPAHVLPPSGDDDLAPIHRSLADGITAAKSNALYAAAMKGSGATIPAPSNGKKTEQSSPDTAGPTSRFPENPSGASLYVAKWVDFSDRYGLAYQLSDQTYGVYFNDATRIVLSADKTHGEYHPHVRSKEARQNPTLPTDRIVPFSMPANNEDEVAANRGVYYPEALTKKVTLLKFFVKYMTPKADEPRLPTPAPYQPTDGPMPFLKKWLRTKHGMLFRLSNRAVQLNFFDHSKIILDSAGASLTYVHRETQERSTHHISDLISQPDGEILVRLKYIRDVLRYLLEFKNTKSAPAGAPAVQTSGSTPSPTAA